MKKYKYFITSCIMLLLSATSTFAQDKEAKMTMSFAIVDSVNVCKVLVTSDGIPVNEVVVSLFVKRLFSNLKLGDPISTDSLGIASFEVPQDIPSPDSKLTVFAKIIDDENYINTETSGVINWGTIVVSDNSKVDERSIFAGRSKAPVFFIIVSLLSLFLVWGTLVYAVLQVFKIKRLGITNN